jgi:hypothetical protein
MQTLKTSKIHVQEDAKFELSHARKRGSTIVNWIASVTPNGLLRKQSFKKLKEASICLCIICVENPSKEN